MIDIINDIESLVPICARVVIINIFHGQYLVIWYTKTLSDEGLDTYTEQLERRQVDVPVIATPFFICNRLNSHILPCQALHMLHQG